MSIQNLKRDQYTNMTRAELAQLGRFHLRLLAHENGLLSAASTERPFLAMNAVEQAHFIFDAMHNKDFQRAWANEPWVAEVFIENPMLCGLAERYDTSAGFNFKFVVAARLDDGTVLYHLLESFNFNKGYITQLLGRLVEDGSARSSRWLDFFSLSGADIQLAIDRRKLGIIEPTEAVELACSTVPVISKAEFEEIMDYHGPWMLAAMQTHPSILAYGRRANKLTSPNTYMIQRLSLSQARVLHTWMKYPTAAKIATRIKLEKSRWVDGEGREEQECRVIITRKEVFDYFKIEDSQSPQLTGASRTRSRNEPYARYADPPEKKLEYCAICRISLQTNKVYECEEGKFCGECEAKLDPGYADNVAVKVKHKVYEVPSVTAPAPNPKFDPRPGIDDVGLGFYSPSWED